MDIRVLNNKFICTYILDSYNSLVWTDRYQECGDFELVVPLTEEIFKVVIPGYYLQIANSDRIMVIESLTTDTSAEEGSTLTIGGRSAESILDRRVQYSQSDYKGSVQNTIKSLLNENFINPTIADRKIDILEFEESDDQRIIDLTLSEEMQVTIGSSIYETINDLCNSNEIGYRITLDEERGKFIFKLYKGLDRTYDQTDNPFVVFSPKFENIINSNYVENYEEFKNVAYICGEGEGDDRHAETYGEASGLDRRELYVNANQVSKKSGKKTLTSAEYHEALRTKGKDELAALSVTKAFDGEVAYNTMYEYGIDFYIGDIVQLENEMGNEGKVYISELINSDDTSEGFKCYPTFSVLEDKGKIQNGG